MALLPIFKLKARDRDGFRIASSFSAQDTSLDKMTFILLVSNNWQLQVNIYIHVKSHDIFKYRVAYKIKYVHAGCIGCG